MQAEWGPVRVRLCPGLGAVHPVRRRADATLSVVPDDPDSDVYVEKVLSEGLVEDHVVTQSYGYGLLEPGLLGPVPLPGNATLRPRVRVAGVQGCLPVSSYRVSNNADLRFNLWEVSAAPYVR